MISPARGGLVVAVFLLLAPAAPARALLAGAASVEIVLPGGTPLAGYGGLPRRAWFPRLFSRSPAFWFKPAQGVHDAPRARALVIESGVTRILFLSVDLVGIDPSLVSELRGRLARSGLGYSGLIVAASHTHSGPGAYGESTLFALLALDHLSPEVRGPILGALEQAARQAEERREPALVGAGRVEVHDVARSRLRAPLDPELGVLKVVARDGRPVALIWNYAIHGTALGMHNLLLSGDLMAEASARIERRLQAPALFVNGAVADVSPARHGWEGVRAGGAALAEAALAAWARIRPAADASLAAVADRVALPSPALALGNCLGGWLPRWVRVGLSSALPTSAEMVAVTVGQSGWVTIPGELETRLGLEIKAARPSALAQVFVAGLSNDYLGYFLTPQAFGRPSYISCASLYGERGGEIMSSAAISLLRRVARTVGP